MSQLMQHVQFHGAWPALLTPAGPDGAVDAAMLRTLTAYLLDKGVDGLYLCGSTGEGVFLSVPERRQVAETVLDVTAGRVPVIVHVGAVATRHAVELALHAREAGAVGVASILPPFGRSVAETYLHYETIAAAVPDVPFYPYLFGGETDALTLMQNLLTRIPNVGGAKYTGPDMYELQAIVDLRREGWTIFSGMDQQCVFAAMFGAPANIGTTLNLMPGVYREIRTAWEAGDGVRARDLQLRVNRVTRLLQQYGIFGALFEAMRVLGLDCGEPRLPRAAMPAERRGPFRAALDAAGFADLANM
jgi:N-acetylneuraminate lyase